MWLISILLLSALCCCTCCCTQKEDYCNLCVNHTMCALPEVGADCAPMISSGLTPEQVTEIVQTHNTLRRKVAKGQETRGLPAGQPQAANMMQMKWDDELASVAQRWANQCTFGHDLCRSVKRFSVGQNVLMSSSSSQKKPANWTATVNSWYNEVATFNSSTIEPFQFSNKEGHYTQVVWADSNTVGCGMARYQSVKTKLWFVTLYVCNYGPAGNVIDQKMYETGPTCGHCPEGTKCDDGLCA